MEKRQPSPHVPKVPRTTFDPYRFPGMRGLADSEEPEAGCPEGLPLRVTALRAP